MDVNESGRGTNSSSPVPYLLNKYIFHTHIHIRANVRPTYIYALF